jgi:hypothetical protein
MAGLMRRMAPGSNRVDSKVAAKQARRNPVFILLKGSLKDSRPVSFEVQIQ